MAAPANSHAKLAPGPAMSSRAAAKKRSIRREEYGRT